MPRVSAEHSQAVRDRLVDAALECAAEKGIQATTTRDVAERASVATGLLFRYFRSRAELILATAERAARERTPRLIRDGAPLSSFERVVAMARSVCSPEDPSSLLPELRFLARRDPELRQALLRYDQTLVTMVSGLLAAAADEGIVAIEDPEATVEALQALFEGLQARLQSNTVSTSADRLATAALSLMAVGVGPESPRPRRRLLAGLLAPASSTKASK